MKSSQVIAISLLAIVFATLGCGESPEPESSTDIAPAAEPAAAALNQTDVAREPELADPKGAEQPIAEFTPPFPDRTEVFEPTKSAQSAVRHEDEHGETVELKGFITVDEPRVVLSIDGVISAIPEGGEKYGVHVHSIKPPTVILERGRQRWPATLE
jgi:hypothetical protein